MHASASLWLLFNLLSIALLAFYSMQEMACVSFNKVRLQYYVSKGFKRAEWLNYLLQNPSRLFGTTLIGVNIALVVGSECAREFHRALGINPDLAPISQVILVVIFGELAPMFAARHYAENVAMLGVPLVYASAKLMAPFLWCLGWISKLCNLIVGGKEIEANVYLNQEELQKIIEKQSDEEATSGTNERLNVVSANIFSLRGKKVKQVMIPIQSNAILPSNATVKQFEALIKRDRLSFIPIYHKEISNIVGIAYPRDLLRAGETRRVRDYAQRPWFITENLGMTQILKQFRSNNESVGVVLNRDGNAVGLIHLNDVLEEIFGEFTYTPDDAVPPAKQIVLVEKTFPGDMTVGKFQSMYDGMLGPNPEKTLSELIIDHLGHRPEKGESFNIDQFEFVINEISLLDVKSVSISTRIK